MSDGSTRATSRRSSHYLPAIDGFRGIGVLIVLLYHAGWSVLTGAFLAIDMFFGVSGYLITSLLLRQVGRWGTVPLLTFWCGRARRLLPAMTGVVVLAAAYAKFFADPTTLDRFRIDMISSLTFWSNWHFIDDQQSYFQGGATVSPLLHTWSLSIEEQFYVVWPLLLLGWLTVRRGRLRGLTAALLVLAGASALWMALKYQPGVDPSSVYYNTFSRAQAILVGCALAVVLELRARRGHGRSRHVPVLLGIPLRSSTWSAAAAIGGLVWLFGVPLLVDAQTEWIFRGGFLVSGLAATGVCWHLATCRSGRISRALEWRPLTAVGKRIYGLYIWHWPLFLILDSQRTHLSGVALVVVRMAVTVAVAFAFDWLVERPIRAGALRRLVPHGGVIAAGLALVLGTTCAFASTAAAKDPIFGTALPGSVTTVTGPMRADQDRVDIFGDSVAFTLWKYRPTGQRSISLGSSTQLGCGVAIPQQLQVGEFKTAPAPQCAHWERRWAALVQETKPRLSVVVSGSAELFDRVVDGTVLKVGTARWRAFLLKAYGEAADVAGQHGRYPVTIANIPCYDRKGASGVGALPGVNQDEDAKAASTQNEVWRQDAVNDVLQQVAKTHENTTLLDMRSYLCPSGKYQKQTDGVTMRPDGVHFGKAGAAQWWRHFEPELRKRFGPRISVDSVSQ
ncbi:acyltransferase family protein [Flexivirga sp. B27]